MNEPIRIAIVDDEYLERDLLKNCIDWEKLGMEIAGEAGNADEALNLIERCRPDIVFTDINMPVMDGLKLSKLALGRNPDLKIVIVTGFDEFDYAQKSIKMGISDFLVKPLIDEDVYKTAVHLKEQIEKKRSDRQEYAGLRRQLLENLPYIKDKFYNELIKGEVDPKSIRERMAFLGITLTGKAFQVAAVECGSAEDFALDEEARILAAVKTMNMARDFFRGMVVFFDTVSRIVVINGDENRDLYDTCEKFRDYAVAKEDCTLCVGLGAIKKELCEISASYTEALEALRYRIAVGNNSVILYSNIHPADRKNEDSMDDFNGKLSFFIKSCLYENAGELVGSYLDGIDLEADNAVKMIRIAAIDIVSVCLKLLNKSGADTDYIYKADVNTNSDILALDTLPEIKNYVLGVVKKSVELMGSMRRCQVSDLINDVKDYVDENYQNSRLSLTSAAKKVFLNPSYLSRTFKKEVGMSFVEYLTKVRMEKAMSLLRQSGDRAFEIAEIVGIPDPNYFCNCFKKYAGVSVSEFRKAGKNLDRAAEPEKSAGPLKKKMA